MAGSQAAANVQQFVAQGVTPATALANARQARANAQNALGFQRRAKGAAAAQVGQAQAANIQAKTAATQQASAQRQAVAAQNAATRQAQRDAAIVSGVAISASETASGIQDAVSSIGEWASNFPTPGGIGILLLILFVLLWAIIPIDTQGYTRLQLLWFTLMGRTQLQGSTQQQNAQTVAALTNTATQGVGLSLLSQNQNTTQDFSTTPIQTL